MSDTVALIPAVLNAHAVQRRLRLRELLSVITVAGAAYGAVLGSFDRFSAHPLQPIYSAVKVPVLLLISFLLTLPTFYVLHALLGLQRDFRSAVTAVLRAQAGCTLVLVSLAPFTALWYASSRDYQSAILFNGLMFAIAVVAAGIIIRPVYGQLIQRDPRHRWLSRAWRLLFAFVAIQMSWVLRPFVGGPGESTAFFRPTAWGNAYVIVWDMLWHQLHG